MQHLWKKFPLKNQVEVSGMRIEVNYCIYCVCRCISTVLIPILLLLMFSYELLSIQHLWKTFPLKNQVEVSDMRIEVNYCIYCVCRCISAVLILILLLLMFSYELLFHTAFIEEDPSQKPSLG